MLLSLDPATSTGYALWHDRDRPFLTGLLRPMGKGRWKVEVYNRASGKLLKTHIADTEEKAWVYLLDGVTAIAAELPYVGVKRAQVGQSLARRVGRIEAVASIMGLSIMFFVPDQWRRIVADVAGVSWPHNREEDKALAVRLVKRLYDLDLDDDQADAVLVGLAYWRTR